MLEQLQQQHKPHSDFYSSSQYFVLLPTIMMMKSIFALAGFAVSAYAQSIVIAGPPEGFTVIAGQTFVVDIARPNTLSSSQEVSVAIGIVPCAQFVGGCAANNVTDILGDVLYAGPYSPTHHPGTPPQDIEFYQNFTLTVPANFLTGQATLNVAHFSLIGASLSPNLEVKNITINVSAA